MSGHRVLVTDVHVSIGDDTVYLPRGTREEDIPAELRAARQVRTVRTPGCDLCSEVTEVVTDDPVLGEHVFCNDSELEPQVSEVTLTGGSYSAITGDFRPFDRTADFNPMGA